VPEPGNAGRTMEILTNEFGDSNEWAPVHESIAGPYLRFSEELLVQTSLI
jgi:hypothetical protein